MLVLRAEVEAETEVEEDALHRTLWGWQESSEHRKGGSLNNPFPDSRTIPNGHILGTCTVLEGQGGEGGSLGRLARAQVVYGCMCGVSDPVVTFLTSRSLVPT